MKKVTITIILIIFIIAILIFLSQILQNKSSTFSQGHTRLAKIIDLEGDVKVVTSGSKKTNNAFKDMRLIQGDRLVTGNKAWVSLDIDKDKNVVVSENSELNISEISGSNNDTITLLRLQTGKVWTNIKEKLSGNSKYEISTPTSTMGVRGTKFYVGSVKNETVIAVLEGKVAISTKILSKGSEGKIEQKDVTLLLDKNKQVSLVKDQKTTQEELNKNIKEVNISSLDINILNIIKDNPEGIDPEIIEEINEVVGYKSAQTIMVKENKVQLSGTVFLPDGKRNTYGGHIHIRNSKNEWVYYGLLNENGEFMAGDLKDGTYWLRSDPAQVSEYARSNEVPFVIKNKKANPSILNINLNTIQVSATIVNPKEAPMSEGHLYIGDSVGNWIYYAEIEKKNNIINAGGLSDGSYKVIAYPTVRSEFVQSHEISFSIRNGKADPASIKLKLNTHQFSGNVLLADGKTHAVGGHVHVRDEKNIWIQYINLDNIGGFKIGGLKDGKYWLQADSSEEADHISSKEFEINIINGKAVPDSTELTLTK